MAKFSEMLNAKQTKIIDHHQKIKPVNKPSSINTEKYNYGDNPNNFSLKNITSTAMNSVSIQKKAIQFLAGDSAPHAIHQTAEKGIQGVGHKLPHFNKVQAAFGQHDISQVKAHTDSHAQTACKTIQAQAYATGNNIAFAQSNPSVHTVAHEATHTLQQKSGVQLKGGIGQIGDRYEKQADAVADKVVRGLSVSSMLSEYSNQPKSNASNKLQLLKLSLPNPNKSKHDIWQIDTEEVHGAREHLFSWIDAAAQTNQLALQNFVEYLEYAASQVRTMDLFHLQLIDYAKAKLGHTPNTAVIDDHGPTANVRKELIHAHRADYIASKSYLQEAEGNLVANGWDVYAQVFEQVNPHSNIIRAVNLNYGKSTNHRRGILLFVHGNHYIRLVAIVGGNYDYIDNAGHKYKENGHTVSDGNCLIDGLHLIGAHKNASAGLMLRVRKYLAKKMPDEHIVPLLEAAIGSMLQGEFVQGLGPNVHGMLRNDPSLWNIYTAKANEKAAIKSKQTAEFEQLRAQRDAEPEKPIVEKGVMPDKHISEEGATQEEFDDYHQALIGRIPDSFLAAEGEQAEEHDVIHSHLIPKEAFDSTWLSSGTLLGLLHAKDPMSKDVVEKYDTLKPGNEKRALLGELMERANAMIPKILHQEKSDRADLRGAVLIEAVENFEKDKGVLFQKVLNIKNINVNYQAKANLATALHYAVLQDNASFIVDALLKRGADVRRQDKRGDTPLHLALLSNHTEYITDLLKSVRRIDIANNAGLTPLAIAQEKGDEQIAAELQARQKQLAIPAHRIDYKHMPKNITKQNTIVMRSQNTGDMYHIRASMCIHPDYNLLIWNVNAETEAQTRMVIGLIDDPARVYYSEENFTPKGFNKTETWTTQDIENYISSKRFIGDPSLLPADIASDVKKLASKQPSDQLEPRDIGSLEHAKDNTNYKKIASQYREHRIKALADQYAPYSKKDELAFAHDLEKFGHVKEGVKYVIVNFRSTGHSDRPGANAPALDTGVIGAEQLIAMVSKRSAGKVIVIPMGEEPHDMIKGPNLLHYWMWPSVKGSRLKQLSLLKFLNDKYDLIGAIGMRSGVMDQLAIAGIRIISIDISPHKSLQDHVLPSLATPKGWDRGIKLERAYGKRYGHVFLKNPRKDEVTRGMDPWPGAFHAEDETMLSDSLVYYFSKSHQPSIEHDLHSSHPTHPNEMTAGLAHMEHILKTKRDITAYDLINSLHPYISHMRMHTMSPGYTQLEKLIDHQIKALEAGQYKSIIWMQQHQRGALLHGKKYNEYYQNQAEFIAKEFGIKDLDQAVDAYLKLNSFYNSPLGIMLKK